MILLLLPALLATSVAVVRAQQHTDSFPSHADVCLVDDDCHNGGQCRMPTVPGGHRHCHCPTGYSGSHCDARCPLTCLNGGRCQKTPVAESITLQQHRIDTDNPDRYYVCKCFGHYTGNRCQTPYVNCGSAERCFNGGVCTVRHDDRTKRQCSCPEGWTGTSCQDLVQNTTASSPSSTTTTTAATTTVTTTAADNAPTHNPNTMRFVTPVTNRIPLTLVAGTVAGITLALAILLRNRRRRRRRRAQVNRSFEAIQNLHDVENYTIAGIDDMSKIHISRGLMLNVI